MAWSVRLLVGWLVGRSVGHNFLKGRELHFPAPIEALVILENLLICLSDVILMG